MKNGMRSAAISGVSLVASFAILGAGPVSSAIPSHTGRWGRLSSAGGGGSVLQVDPLPRPAPSGSEPYLPAGPSPWTALANQPPFSPGSMLLQTDGSVLVHEDDSGDWWRLTPTSRGDYVHGTWSQIASMPAGYAPLYFASAVLPSGQMIVEGGEYNGGSTPVRTKLGAIYNPLTNTWTSVSPPPGWGNIGDAPSAVLPNGTFMLGNCCTTQAALFNAKTLTWTATGTNKADINNEEGWTLLGNGKVLTVDTRKGRNSELYTPGTGSWASGGATPVGLVAGSEMGAQVRSPNQTVFAVGATGATAVYQESTGTWSAGPSLPVIGGKQFASFDGPGSILPDGDVLLAASPRFSAPTHFFLYSGQTLTQVADAPQAPSTSTYFTRMLVLPTGQVMYDDTVEMDVYTPTGTAPSSWRPVISSVPTSLFPGGTYALSGTGLAGLTQGAAYGDDFQDATNYPLVRITDTASGTVTYARTAGITSLSIASGVQASTKFTLPAGTPRGPSSLVVVANGIASAAVPVTVI